VWKNSAIADEPSGRSRYETVTGTISDWTASSGVLAGEIIWLYSGQMRYEIVMAPQAAASLRSLPALDRAAVRDALETHLRFEPAKVSKSRIKRLRGIARPQYRLRVNDIRVFHDIAKEEVQVLAIVAKAEAQAWLDAFGEAAP
jgi:mRNA-degrading endonuclease RelE of RelBE toxin-antitoxin system